MKACDPQPLAKVERMGILALGAGVEAERIAARFSGQCDEPLQHCLTVTLRTRRLVSDQIVDVERLATRQHVLYPEPRDRNDCASVFQRCELIPLRLLSVDARAKLFGDQQGPKLAHHGKAAIDLSGRSGDLDSPHASSTSFLWRADA